MTINTPVREFHWLRYATIAFVVALLIMFFGRGFIDPDEGRYAEIPREMVASAKWLEMRIFGYRYYEKPPLAYWLTASSIALCGARDWAARIPLFLNFVLLACLFYRFLLSHWDVASARKALLITSASMGTIAGMALLMTDPFLVLFFSLTCICAYQWFLTPPHISIRRIGLAIGAGVFGALGFLTKGAVALVLPGMIMLVWMLWERRWRQLRLSFILLAAIPALVIIAGFLLLIERHNPGFFLHFVWEEHIARFRGVREIQGHPEPPWFYFGIIPVLLLPWSFFLFRAVRMIITRRALSSDQLSRFFLIWSLVVVSFFSVSAGKLMSYILPALPPMFLLFARWGIVEPHDGSVVDRHLIKIGIAGVILFIAALSVGWLISYFQLLPQEIHPIRGITLLAFAPLLLCLSVFRHLRVSQSFVAPLTFVVAAVFVVVALLMTPLAGRHFNVSAHHNSSIVYKTLAKQLQPDDQIISFRSYRPALPFYTQRLCRMFQTKNELRYGMRMEPERLPDMECPDEIRAMLAEAYPAKVYAVMNPDDFHLFKELELNYHELTLLRDPMTMVVEVLP